MEHGFLDRYSGLDTPVHRLDPRAKALLALAFVIAVVSTPSSRLLAFVVYAGLLSWTAALARVPLGYVCVRAATVLPFSKLGAPVILVDLLALTYRYLFVLVGEAMRLRRAAAARGYRPRWLGQAILIGRLAGQLFVRSHARAERVYGAMVLRGYDGRMPASRPLRLRTVDVGALLVLIPTFVLVRMLVR